MPTSESEGCPRGEQKLEEEGACGAPLLQCVPEFQQDVSSRIWVPYWGVP